MADDYTNTIDTTGAVAVGGSATGTIETAQDRDWFAVELEAGRTYRFDLKGSPTGDGTLSDTFLRRILDADGDKSVGDGAHATYNDDFGGTRNSQVTFTAKTSGTYYVETSGDRNETGTYTLSVTDVTPAAVPDEPAAEDPPAVVSDPDAARAGAQDLGDITALAGARFPRGEVDGTDDALDYYRFTLTEARTVELGLRQQDANADLYLEDAEGNVVAESTRDGAANEALQARLDAGTYYVRVAAQEAGANAYVFRYGVTTAEAPAQVADTDAVRAGAQDLGDLTALDGVRFPRDSLDGDGDRVDYYRFTLTEAKAVALGLRQQDANADLYLEDAEGNVLHGGTAAGTANEWVSATVLAGTYYVRVEAKEAGANAHVFRYGVSEADAGEVARLQAQHAGPPTSVSEPEGSDFSADASTSGRVLAGESVTGNIAAAGDVDWFAVEMQAGTTYRLDLLGSDPGQGTLADPYLRGVHDSQGNLLSGTENGDGGEGRNARVAFTPEAGGTHYIAAGGDGSHTGTYRLAVTPAVWEVDVADAEAHESDGTIRFRVTLDWAPLSPVTVGYETVDGTALAGEDYEAKSGTLTFAEGETEQWVEVTLVDDTEEDSGETFGLRLTEATGAVLGDAEGTGTILNAETPVSVPEPSGTDFAADTTTTGRVVVGESVTGRIETTRGNIDVDWFAVALEAGTTYQFDLEGLFTHNGTLVDPGLRGIHDAEGEFIAGTRDDNSGKAWNSRVVFAPAETGTYYVAATTGGIWSLSAGTYTLSVKEFEDDYAAGTETSGVASVGGTTTGTIETMDDVDWFAVELEAGRTYRIDNKGGHHGHGSMGDPYLRGVYDDGGNLIAGTTDDDGGSGPDSRVDVTPTKSGTYYLAAGSPPEKLYGKEGTYRLSVTDITDGVADDFAADTTTTGAVSAGDSATGEIEFGGDHDWFAVELEADKTYRIDMEGRDSRAGTLQDPYLRGIHDTNGNLIPGTTDDNTGARSNSRLDFTATETGTYYLAADGQGGEEGTYRLSVTDISDGVPDDFAADTTTTGRVSVGGSATGEIEFANDYDWFAVELEADTTYRIDLKGACGCDDSGTLRDPYLGGIHDTDGNFIRGTTNNSSGEGSNSRVFFTPAEAGTYYVAATDACDWEGTYTLSVEEAM